MREQIVEENMGVPSPEELLALARVVKPLPVSRTLTDYLEVICMLRDKGLTWKETAQWLTDHGLAASPESVSGCWHKYGKKH